MLMPCHYAFAIAFDYYVILRHACHYADTYAICHAAHAYFADAAAFISSD
jgi:hypothetical protein